MIAILVILVFVSFLVFFFPLETKENKKEEKSANYKAQMKKLWQISQTSMRERKPFRAEKALLTILKFDEKNAAAKDLLAEMEKALEGKVKAVRLSNRLKSHAVCLSSDGDLSLEMEKVLNTMPTGRKVQAERVLELNPEHPVFAKLESLLNDDKEKLAQYAELLYQQALLIEGLPVEDPVALSKMICDLMV